MPPGTYTAGSASVNIVPDFSNAQRMIRGWFAGLNDVEVNVTPNLNNLAQARVQQQLNGLGSKRIPVELDHALLERSILRATDSLAGLSDTAAKVGVVFSTKAGVVTALGGALVEMGAAASQAAGALLLAPAAITALVAPIGAVVLATRGVSDAFKAVWSGDAVKMQEALEKLSPAARRFVTELGGMKQEFTDLKLNVQEGLFTGLGDSIHTLAHATLPLLNTRLRDIANEFGRLGAGIADTLSSAAGIRDLDTILGHVTESTKAWADSAGPMTQIWLDITTVGSEFLPGMANGMAGLAQSTAEWVHNARESGQLNEIIQIGIDRIKQLWDLLVQVGATLVAIFKPAIEAGADLITMVTDLFNSFNRIVSLPTGQSSLRTFFESIRNLFETLMPALTAVFEVIVNDLLPVFAQLFDAFGPVAAMILEEFADLFHQIAPLLGEAAGAAAALFTGVAPLVHVFSELVQIVLPPLITIMEELGPLFGELTAEVGEFLVQAFEELEPLLELVGELFIDMLEALMPLVPVLLELARQILPVVVDVLMQLLPPIAELVENLVPVFIEVLRILGPHLGALVKAFGDLLIALLPILPPLTDLLELILPPLAVVIGLVIDYIARWIEIMAVIIVKTIEFATTVVNWFRDMWDKVVGLAKSLWENVSNFFTQLWETAVRLFTDMRDRVIGLFTALRDAVVGLAQNTWDWVSDRFTGMRDGVVNIVSNLWNRARDIFTTGRDWVVGVAQNVWDWTVDKFTRMKDGVIGLFDQMWQGVQRVWESVKGAVARPINFVINTVLNNGLFAGWNWLVDTLNLPAGWHAHINPIPGYAKGGSVMNAKWDARDGGRVPGTFLGPEADNVFAKLNTDEFVVQTSIAKKTRNFLEALNAGQPEALQAAGGAYANPTFAPGYAGGGNVDRAVQIARFMNGKPYIWGGAGPQGADCSGFMSILTRAMRDEANPYRRIGTTGNFPWPGFTNGWGEPFTIGNTRNAFNSGIGHMAGTLGNHSVESGSGHGPMIDGRALNAGAGLFTQRGYESQGVSTPGKGTVNVEPPWYEKLWGSITGAFDWLKGHLSAPVDALFGSFGHYPLTELLAKLPPRILDILWDKAKDAVGNLFAGGYESADTLNSANTGGARGDVEQVVRAAFAAKGWNNGPQWAAASNIISSESSWNPRAQNPNSSASGLFQHIDSTWARYRPQGESARHMKDAGVNNQAYAGWRYIDDRYGTPVQAWDHWKSHHSYDDGGWIPPGISSIYNGTGRPEPVLTGAEHDGLLRWRYLNQRDTGASSSQTVGMVVNGNVITQDVEALGRMQRQAARRAQAKVPR